MLSHFLPSHFHCFPELLSFKVVDPHKFIPKSKSSILLNHTTLDIKVHLLTYSNIILHSTSSSMSWVLNYKIKDLNIP